MLKHVEFHTAETLKSFLSRTAAVNGAGDMRALLKHLGTSWGKVSGEMRLDESHLSTELGISVERLYLAKFQRISRTRVSVNGHEFRAGSFRPGPYHYCPLCLVDDMSVHTGSNIERPFARLSWAMTIIDVCTVHGVRLAVAEDFGRASDDFVRCVSSRWAKVEHQASRCEATELSPSVRYFSDRLGVGSIRVPLLDELTFQAAVDVCEHLGCQLGHGSEINLSQQPPEMRARFQSDGFRLIAQGEEALRAHLTDAAKRYWSTAAWHPLSSLFGNLHLVLSRHVEAYPRLTRLLREIVQKNLPVGPEDTFLGAPCERRIHTVSTIARQHEIPKSTVRAILGRAALLDSSDRFKGDAEITFGNDVLRDEFEREAHLVSYDNLIRRMGLFELADTCVFDPSWEFALRRRPTFDRGELYSVADAEALFDRMTRSASGGANGLVSIRDAARLSLSSPTEVVQLLASGALKRVGRFGRRFAGIKVSYTEVRDKLAETYDSNVLHYEDVAGELAISVPLANALMREQRLPVSIIDLPGYSKTYPVMSRAALDRFRGEHISVSDCATERGLPRDTVIACLEHANVLPSIITDRGLPVFFKREDVERGLPK